MVSAMRRLTGWVLRQGGRAAVDTALRMGGRSAVDSALGAAAEVVPKTSQRSHLQVFNVTSPVTVYVRASHCRVIVRSEKAAKVILEANLYRAFGVEMVAEQDAAGVYIVIRRKPVVGTISRATLTLTVPPEAFLALHLTPGEIVFENIDGMIKLPAGQVFDSVES
jgi:hypothetical protein